MSFTSPSFPAGEWTQRLPNIHAFSSMQGRLNDDSGSVTGYGNAVLTKSVGALVWEALAYLETIHGHVAAQAAKIEQQAAVIDQLSRKLGEQGAGIAACREFVEALVTIPLWRTKAEVEMGDDMVGERPSAEDLGLAVTYVLKKHVAGREDGDVISIAPPAGSLVRRGSPVLITVNSNEA